MREFIDLFQCVAIIALVVSLGTQRNAVKALHKQVRALHKEVQALHTWVRALNLLVREVSGLGDYSLNKFGNCFRREQPGEQCNESCDTGDHV